MHSACPYASVNLYRYYKNEDNGTVTDEESLSSFDLIGVDLDQEAVINTNQVEGSGMCSYTP